MKNNPNAKRLFKVTFVLSPGWHKSQTETVWAAKSGKNHFILMNSPFLAFGVSYLDEVHAKKMPTGELMFVSVFKRSGHSTYRLMLQKELNQLFDSPLSDLEELGCTYEEGRFGSNVLLSLDVPPHVDVQTAFALMLKGQNDQLWDFEEGHFGHIQ